MNIVHKIIVFGLLGVSLAIFCMWTYINLYFWRHAPEQPDAIHGVTFPVNIHGTTVYLTAGQWHLFGSPTSGFVGFLIFLSAAVGACLLNLRWRVLQDDHEA